MTINAGYGTYLWPGHPGDMDGAEDIAREVGNALTYVLARAREKAAVDTEALCAALAAELNH